MTDIATLSVDIIARDQVSAILKNLDAQLDKTNTSATRAGKAIGDGVGSGTQKAASSSLALQQAQARLEQQQGNLAGAADRLKNALAQVGTTTVQSVNAQRQLLAVESQLATGTSALGGHFKDLQGSVASVGGAIGGLPGQLLSVASGIGGITAAIGAGTAIVTSFADAFKFKADLDATTASINAQLKGVRDTSQVYAQAAAFAGKFKLTQEETTKAIAASIGVMRASKSSVEDILSVLARLQVLSPEQSLEEAAVAIKALASGDTTSLVTRFEVGRDVASQMKQEIQGGADAVQVMSKFLNDTGIGMDTLAAKTTGASGAMKELAQAQEQLKIAQAEFAQGPGLTVLNGQIAVTTGLTRGLSGDFATAQQSILNASQQGSFGFNLFNAILGGSLERIAAYQAASNATASTAAQVAAQTQAEAAATAAYTAALEATGSTTQANAAYEAALAASLQATAIAATVSTGAMVAAAAGNAAHATSAQLATDAAAKQSAATQQTAEAAVLAAAQQAAQTQATANLTAATTTAVTAFLNLNPNIDAAGIAAAVAAGKIPALIGQLANLRIAAYSARDAVAALAAQQAINTKVLATPGIAAPGVTSGRNNDANAVVALQKANADAAKARSDQILAVGNDQQKLNELEKQYGDAVKTSGATSAAAINAETRLKQERIAAAKAATKAAKGKGGGAKLTDQQKLNNSLLASQDQYAQKAEDAERSHLDRILQINADAAEKLKKAQDSFAQSQLDGRAGFYDSLGSIEDAGLRQALSAQYEAAFQEADQIAREKGADVGQKFLEARQAAIQAQGQRASEIAQATKEGDKDKAAYLAGVDKLYRDAEDRKLQAIKDGQGSIQSDQAAALAEEGTKYADAQAKIGDSADQAAARKIAAAERAGQAVTAEGIQVDALKTKYDALAVAGARAGVTPATTSPAPATGTQGAAAAVSTTTDIASALAALRDAIGAVERATTNAGKGVESAVRGLSGKFAT